MQPEKMVIMIGSTNSVVCFLKSKRKPTVPYHLTNCDHNTFVPVCVETSLLELFSLLAKVRKLAECLKCHAIQTLLLLINATWITTFKVFACKTKALWNTHAECSQPRLHGHCLQRAIHCSSYSLQFIFMQTIIVLHNFGHRKVLHIKTKKKKHLC